MLILNQLMPINVNLFRSKLSNFAFQKKGSTTLKVVKKYICLNEPKIKGSSVFYRLDTTLTKKCCE